MHDNEQKIVITLESVYEGNYADHGVEFECFGFSAPPGMQACLVEQLLNAIPGCSERVDFKYESTTGKGGFILLGCSTRPGHYHFTSPGPAEPFSITGQVL